MLPKETSPAPTSPPSIPLALLVLIAFSGTLAMHVFVPALPEAALALKTDSATIQLSITVYILGLAIGQLIYGPVSDAVGRRPSVLVALAIYLLGGLASLFAPNVELLLVARFVQALGGAGGLSLTRVIVADTSSGLGTTRKIAILNMILLLGPGLAPIIGAQILGLSHWRVIFAALSLMGAAALVLTWRSLPETTQPSHQLDLATVAGKFRKLFTNRGFRRCITGGAFGSTSCYAYFVSAPFILHSEMGLSVQDVGFWVGTTLAAAAAGSFTTRSIIGKVRDRSILLGFASLGTVTGLAFLLLALFHLLTPVSVVALSLLTLFAAGGLGPVTIATAFRFAKENVGSAAGIWGSAQMVSGGLCSFIAAQFSDHALGCGLMLFLGYAFALFQMRRIDFTAL